MENKDKEVIDLREVFKKLREKKMLLGKVLCITFVLSCAWILPQPRFYTASVSLAPEAGGDDMGGLGALASSFGFNFGGSGGGDAYYPQLYPDLMSSTDFIVSLFNIPVETIDGEVKTDLYSYETKHQKTVFYKIPIAWVKRTVKNMFSEPETPSSINDKINPFRLTEKQDAVVEKMKNDIVCKVDQLTNVFTITVKAQDPLVAATIADSVRQRLQDYIIKYRTNKAHIDLQHYKELTDKAEKEYNKAVAAYSSYQDSHYDMQSQMAIAQGEKLERDMQNKYNTYTAMMVQMQAAEAKLQEKTPAFSILQNASVPVKPAGPKRMIFVALMLFIAFVGTTSYILKDELTKTLALLSRK